jgi:hypothetical protein
MMHLGQNNTALSRGLLAAIYTPHHYYLFHCDYGGLNTSSMYQIFTPALVKFLRDLPAVFSSADADLEEFNQFKRDMEKVRYLWLVLFFLKTRPLTV